MGDTIILRRGRGGSGSSSSSNALALVANNCQPSSNSYTDINPVKNHRSRHKSGPTGYRVKKVAFINGTFTTNGEINAYHDWGVFTASLTILDRYVQLTFGGATSTTVAKEWGEAIGDCDTYIPPNTDFFVNNYIEAADAASSLITIIGITQANPCVVTYTGVDPVEGDVRRFASVGGMTQVNYATNGSIAYSVKNLNTTAKTFELWNSAGSSAINSTGYTAYTSGGTASREYQWHYNTIGTQLNAGGTISQSYAGRADYTMGIGLPGGALPANCFPMNASVVTGGSLNTGTSTVFENQQGSTGLNGIGAAYTGGLSLAFYYGAAGPNQAGSEYAGSGASGNSNQSGGLTVSVSINSGGSGYDADNLPQAYLGGGGGFGSSTQAMYGPQAILGVPDDDEVPSVIGLGDSVMAAMMSADGTGDIHGNFGVYEQAVANRAGFMKFACNGNSISGWLQNNTRQLAFLDNLVALGFRPTVAILGFGSNDFASSNYSDQVDRVANNITTAIAVLKTHSIPKVVTTTIKPRVAVSGSSTITGAITGATQANPCVITDTAHGLATGAIISIASVGGMTQLNGNSYMITVLTANTFSLQTLAGVNVDSTAYGAYTSGGTWTFTFRSLASQNGITVDDGVNPVDSSNYGASGRVLTYNQGIRTGTLIPEQDGFLDLAILMADSAAPYRFRVEGQFYLGSYSQTAFTNDGIHPNIGAGIPYATIWMNVRALGIKSTPLIPTTTTYIKTPKSGEAGQRVISTLPSASSVALTTATSANITTLILSAGTWEINGQAEFVLTSATSTNFKLSISQVSATLGATQSNTINNPAMFTLLSDTLSIPIQKIVTVPFGKTTTFYMVGQATFSAGSISVYGSFGARRLISIN